MKRVLTNRCSLTALVGLAVGSCLIAPAEADYIQGFNSTTPTSPNLPISSIDVGPEQWKGYLYDASTGTAVDISGAVGASPAPRIGIAAVNGANLPSTPTRGYLFAASGAGADPDDAYSAIGVIPSIAADAISWYQASNADIDTRLLVQSGGNWYVSTASWNSTSVGGLTGAAELQDEPAAGDSLISVSFDGTAANWLSFDPTTDASPIGGVAVGDLSSSLTGIGFYFSGDFSGSNTARLDSLTVTSAVPEPASLALLGMGMLCLATLGRRA